MSRYAHVLNYLTTHPWAIRPETLHAMIEVLTIRLEGGRLSDDEIAVRMAAAKAGQGDRAGKRTGVTAVIPIYGVIMPHASIMDQMSGASSLDQIRGDFRDAMADEDVARIVFDIDSPGGSVEGVEEFADEVRSQRGVKPITAVANYLMASAAYWIGSQADEVIASPSSMVGSIGVYAIHQDMSGAYELLGVRPTLIKAGKFKAEGIDFEPLGEEARAHFQESVDDSYDAFIAGVSKGRGVTGATVRNGYGEGRALTAKRAKAAGLVDRVDTLDGAFAKTPKMREAKAEDMDPAVVGEADAMLLGGQGLEPDSLAFAFERERRERLGLGKAPVTSSATSAGAFLPRRG